MRENECENRAIFARYSCEFAVYSRSHCRRKHRESPQFDWGILWGTVAPWRVKKGPFLSWAPGFCCFTIPRNIATIPTL